MKQEIEQHLLGKIVPFWTKLADWKTGGFFGYVSTDLAIQKTADRGLVQQARILWTFSALENRYRDGRFRPFMEAAYRFLTAHLADPHRPGFFWISEWDGVPHDSRKVVYGQGFAIYGLSEYYKATHDSAALAKARETFDWIEKNAYDADTGGYWEEFDAAGNRTACRILGDGIPKTVYTVNTAMHLLEAYMNFYEAYPDETVKTRTIGLLRLLCDKMYDPILHSLHPYLNAKLDSLETLRSFGHDIEAAWLIDQACRKIGYSEPGLVQMTAQLAESVLRDGFNGSYVANHEKNGIYDRTETWWVECEAMIGFYNHYQKTGDGRFLMAVEKIWKTVNETLVDSRPDGEWFWSADEYGKINFVRGMAELWKCPYHNSRAMLELIERME